MQNSITEKMFSKALPLVHKTCHHPFIAQLADGSLPREKFVYYLQQDSLYLIEYARALAFVAAKSLSEANIALGLSFAQEALLAERELHFHYFSEFQVVQNTEKMPACLMYSSYLLGCVAWESVSVAMASLLPCFWIYNEVGKHVLAIRSKNNPYDSWIDLYAGEEFAEGVRQAVRYTNELGEQAGANEQERMITAFLQATKLEYQFWDDAHKLRGWNI